MCCNVQTMIYGIKKRIYGFKYLHENTLLNHVTEVYSSQKSSVSNTLYW